MLGAERDEVGHDGDEVDDVHGVAEERRAVRTEREARRQLGREPDDAARLDDEERISGNARSVAVSGRPRLSMTAVSRDVDVAVITQQMTCVVCAR